MNNLRRRKKNTGLKDGRNVRKTIHVYGSRGKQKLERRRRIFIFSQVLLISLIIGVMFYLAFSGKTFLKNDNKSGKNEVTNEVAGEENQSGPEVIDLSFLEENGFMEPGSEETEPEQALPTEEIEDADLVSKVSPTSFLVDWSQYAPAGDYILRYKRCDNQGEHHGKNYTEDKTMNMSDICSAYNEDESSYQLVKAVTGTNISLTGLIPSTEYSVELCDKEGNVFASETVKTSGAGYCDPFKAVDSLFIFSSRDASTGAVISKDEPRTVTMTAAEGCLGTEAKPVMEAAYYSEADRTNKISSFSTGTDLFITDDADGHYCYLRDDKGYSVYVVDGNGNTGWVDARTLLVDAAHMYATSNGLYGICINRTNAYSSIFTTGGDAMKVDYSEDANSRYNAISTNTASEYMTTTGYNLIEGITGSKLPNYGNENQMPVLWDLALELKQCQKSALENGYSLLIYDGYRPMSSSQSISGTLSGLGYLGMPVFGTNLAQGYLTDQTYSVSFYIAQKSRHNKGTATDLTLISYASPEQLGAEVDMQTKMHTLDYRCNMKYNNWEADLLTDIMIGHGSHLEYLAVRSEWWHFQLKSDRSDLYPLISKYTYVDFVF